MQAIQGLYRNCVVMLDEKLPFDNVKVIVVFPGEDTVETRHNENFADKTEEMSTEEALRIFHKYSGSISREIDYEKEKDDYLNEKYGSLA